MNSQKTVDKFIAMWDMYGLESLINVSEGEQENIVRALKGEKPSWRNPIQYMIIRAQANIQRCYEIYIFESEVDEVSIRECFNDNPQFMADLIRERGHRVYSDRNTRAAVIT